MRLSQSKFCQKSPNADLKVESDWKKSVCVYINDSNKHIDQVCAGFRNSVALLDGKLFCNKSREGELLPLRLSEHNNSDSMIKQFLQVSCGPDYIVALEYTGKLYAWGNKSMVQVSPF